MNKTRMHSRRWGWNENDKHSYWGKSLAEGEILQKEVVWGLFYRNGIGSASLIVSFSEKKEMSIALTRASGINE